MSAVTPAADAGSGRVTPAAAVPAAASPQEDPSSPLDRGSSRDAAGADWPAAWGGPDRTSYAAQPLDAARLALAWQYPAQPESLAFLSPVIAGNYVYSTVATGIVALDRGSGQFRWKFTTATAVTGSSEAPPALSTAPLCVSDRLYAGTVDGRLLAMDAARGTLIGQWRTDGAISAAPAASNDMLYCGTADGALYAWSLSEPEPAKPTWANWIAPHDPLAGPLALRGERLYAVTRSGRVFVVNPRTGKVLAKTALPTEGAAYGPAIGANGVLVSRGGTLYCLSPETLQPKWTQTFVAAVTAQPAEADGMVLAITADGSLYALDEGAGARRWAVALGDPARPQPGPTIAADIVYVPGAHGQVYAFSLNGDGAGSYRLLWQYSVPQTALAAQSHPWLLSDLASPAAACGSSLYVQSSDGAVTCLSTTAADLEGPVVDARFPEGGPYEAPAAAQITARVQDRGSGYRRGSLRLFVDGTAITSGYTFQPDTGRLEYAPPQLFGEGTHTVEVTASDNRGNRSDTRWKFSIRHPVTTTAVTGEPATGSRPRAGVPGKTPGMPAATTLTPLLTNGALTPNYVAELKTLNHWTHFPLLVYFIPDDEYRADREQAAIAGFNRWALATSSRISFRVVSTRIGADVTVRFDPTMSDGLTYTESAGSRLIHADISLGVSLPNHPYESMPPIDVECVAAHEFGHALGLSGHSSHHGDLMYFQHTVGEPWDLTQRDLNTLRVAYQELLAPLR